MININKIYQTELKIDANSPVHYISGNWQKGKGDTSYPLINPSTEKSYGFLQSSSLKQVQEAIDSAKDTFPSWKNTSKEERYHYVEKILNIYQKHYKTMAHTISFEMGAPIDFSYASQAAAGENDIKSFLDAFQNFSFKEKLSQYDNEAMLFYHPLGVAGLITPWNWPIHQIVLKVVAALLAGCTMVLKPSEISPLSAILFAQILNETELPKGVFHLIQGGSDIGQYLSQSEDISILSFTGSTRAGIDITKQSAKSLKKVTLELGGKGANLLLEDCDEKTYERVIYQMMRNSGQSCNAPSRFLVARPILDDFLKKAKEIVKKITVNSSDKPGSHIGPLSSKKQHDHALELIKSGIKEGAKLLCGGDEKPPHLSKGYYILPTIFYDVLPTMRIFKEEIFGPVLSVTAFDTIEEAISLANYTNYGLTNYIQTQNEDKALEIAKKLRSGMVEINGNFLPKDSFFGGVGASGYARERGLHGIREYCYTQAVSKRSLDQKI